MFSKTIGRHVALIGTSLDRRQGFLVAAGFVVGCVIWLASWGWDYRDGSWGKLQTELIGFRLTGEWIRENLARRLIEISSILAIVLAYLKVTGRHFDQFRARHWLREHVIVCGMSSRSQILAHDLVRQGKEVVIIDLDPPEARVMMHRQAGVCIIHGDATSAAVLRSAGITRARRVVCLTGSDDTNCAIVEACRNLLVSGEYTFSGELNVHCHIQNLRLRAQLGALQIFVRGLVDRDNRYSARFRLFCIESCAASELVQQFSPERRIPIERQQRDVHILVLGVGVMTQALLLQLAHVCHYWRSEEEFDQPASGVRVTLVGSGAESLWLSLLALAPALKELISIRLIDRSLDDATTLEELDECTAQCRPSQVFVALPETAATISQSLFILNRYDALWPREWSGVIAAVLPPQLNPIDLDEWNKDRRLKGYDLYAACSADVVIGEVMDRIASDIHNRYFEREKARLLGQAQAFAEGGFEDKSAMHPWMNLNEWYRNSNRYAAQHFAVKLRAIGWQACELKPGESPVSCSPRELKETLEALSCLSDMEHRRWMAFYRLGGWKYGPVRQDDLRIHPSIKPYGQLGQAEKNKDRRTVRAIRKQLLNAGYTLRKSRVVGVCGHRWIAAETLPALEQACALALASLPGTGRVLLSGLAEGADQIVARIALDSGWPVVAVLPMPLAEYEKDFTDLAALLAFRDLLARCSSRIELPLAGEIDDDIRASAQPRDGVVREQQYRNLGRYLVDNVQSMVLLWDGNERDVKPGGTAEVKYFCDQAMNLANRHGGVSDLLHVPVIRAKT